MPCPACINVSGLQLACTTILLRTYKRFGFTLRKSPQKPEGTPHVSTRFSLSMEMSRLTRDGTVEPVSRDQILRRERGQGNSHFPCSADHEQDWQPYPVDAYSCYTIDVMTIHTCYTQYILSAHSKRAVVIGGWLTLSSILHCKFPVAVGFFERCICVLMCKGVPLRATEAVWAELGLCVAFIWSFPKILCCTVEAHPQFVQAEPAHTAVSTQIRSTK